MPTLPDRRNILYVMIGLPASGKSTIRRALVTAGAGTVKSVNRDSLRDMLDAGIYAPANEDYVVHVESKLISEMLSRGWDVIVDDTNFDPKIRERWKDIADAKSATYVEVDLSQVPVETCIARDDGRIGSARVGEEVIRRMYDRWLA